MTGLGWVLSLTLAAEAESICWLLSQGSFDFAQDRFGRCATQKLQCSCVSIKEERIPRAKDALRNDNVVGVVLEWNLRSHTLPAGMDAP